MKRIEELDALIKAAFALSAETLTLANQKAVERGLGPDTVAASFMIGLGRLAGTFTKTSLSAEEFWQEMMHDDSGKVMFLIGFEEERGAKTKS